MLGQCLEFSPLQCLVSPLLLFICLKCVLIFAKPFCWKEGLDFRSDSYLRNNKKGCKVDLIRICIYSFWLFCINLATGIEVYIIFTSQLYFVYDWSVLLSLAFLFDMQNSSFPFLKRSLWWTCSQLNADVCVFVMHSYSSRAKHSRLNIEERVYIFTTDRIFKIIKKWL